MKNIAIVSREGDFHALLIQHQLNQYPDVKCHLIETDRLCGRSSINWSLSNIPDTSFVMSNKAEKISVETINLIWWRKIISSQQIPPEVSNLYTEFINTNFYLSFVGNLYTKFSGKWISHPVATNTASNKLVQLQAAKKCGFRVPQTIVSQDPDVIREFHSTLNAGVIIKSLHPSANEMVLTNMLTKDYLSSDESIRLCPAIYQEFIPGAKHLRVNCFGREIYAALLETSELDWRPHLDKTKMKATNLDADTKECIYRVCKELQLEMGIFDFKLTPDGDIVWLEVNPQGQFLFIQGIIGVDLASAFTKFLYDQSP